MDHSELEQLVRAKPQDRDAMQVYVDALLEAGDPRGELAALDAAIPVGLVVGLRALRRELVSRDDVALRDHPDEERIRALIKSERALLGEHGPKIASELLPYSQFLTDLQWRSAFLIHLDFRTARLLDPPEHEQVLRGVIDAITTSESTRFLRSLVVRDEDWMFDMPLWRSAPLMSLLLSADLSCLRSLALDCDIEDLAGLSRAAPNLQTLCLSDSRGPLETLELPELIDLKVGCRNDAGLISLRGARLPNLRSLEVRASWPDPLGAQQLSAFTPDAFPNLRRIAMIPMAAHGSARALLESGIVSQLEQLEMNVYAEDARAFAAARDAIAHLDAFSLGVQYPTDDIIDALAGVCEITAIPAMPPEDDPEDPLDEMWDDRT